MLENKNARDKHHKVQKCPKNKAKTTSIRQRLPAKHTCIDLADSFSFADGVVNDFLVGGCSLDVPCLFLVSFIVICNNKKHNF